MKIFQLRQLLLLMFVPLGGIHEFVDIMAWRRTGDNPLSFINDGQVTHSINATNGKLIDSSRACHTQDADMSITNDARPSTGNMTVTIEW